MSLSPIALLFPGLDANANPGDALHGRELGAGTGAPIFSALSETDQDTESTGVPLPLLCNCAEVQALVRHHLPASDGFSALWTAAVGTAEGQSSSRHADPLSVALTPSPLADATSTEGMAGPGVDSGLRVVAAQADNGEPRPSWSEKASTGDKHPEVRLQSKPAENSLARTTSTLVLQGNDSVHDSERTTRLPSQQVGLVDASRRTAIDSQVTLDRQPSTKSGPLIQSVVGEHEPTWARRESHQPLVGLEAHSADSAADPRSAAGARPGVAGQGAPPVEHPMKAVSHDMEVRSSTAEPGRPATPTVRLEQAMNARPSETAQAPKPMPRPGRPDASASAPPQPAADDNQPSQAQAPAFAPLVVPQPIEIRTRGLESIVRQHGQRGDNRGAELARPIRTAVGAPPPSAPPRGEVAFAMELRDLRPRTAPPSTATAGYVGPHAPVERTGTASAAEAEGLPVANGRTREHDLDAQFALRPQSAHRTVAPHDAASGDQLGEIHDGLVRGNQARFVDTSDGQTSRPASVPRGQAPPAAVQGADGDSQTPKAESGAREPAPLVLSERLATHSRPAGDVQPARPAGLSSASQVERVQALSEQAAQQPARSIAMQIHSGERGTASVVFADRAGQVQVTVRSADPSLAQSLRGDLTSLAGSLEQQGFEVKTSKASDFSADDSRQNDARPCRDFEQSGRRNRPRQHWDEQPE